MGFTPRLKSRTVPIRLRVAALVLAFTGSHGLLADPIPASVTQGSAFSPGTTTASDVSAVYQPNQQIAFAQISLDLPSGPRIADVSDVADVLDVPDAPRELKLFSLSLSDPLSFIPISRHPFSNGPELLVLGLVGFALTALGIWVASGRPRR